MPSIRLFIGGLSNSVAADEISKKLSSYGAIVSNLDVKEKKDLITGDVIKRFAFANIDGAESSLSNCISSLNGIKWQGSILTVKQAQESFLDRLKKEREEKNNPTEAPKIPVFSGNLHIKPERVPQISYNENKLNKKSGKEGFDSITPDKQFFNNSFAEREGYKAPVKVENNYAEKRRSFKQESDPFEENYDHEVPEEENWDQAKEFQEHLKMQQLVSAAPARKRSRYDPKSYNKSSNEVKSSAETVVTKPKDAVSSAPTSVNMNVPNIEFTGASSEFSLLKMFESGVEEGSNDTEIKEETDNVCKEEEEAHQHASPPPLPPPSPAKKPSEEKYTKPFFVRPSDEQIADNLDWVYLTSHDSCQAKFLQDRSSILYHYKERARRLKNLDHKREVLHRDRDGEMVQSLGTVRAVKLMSDELSVGSFKNPRLKQVLELMRKGKDPGSEEFLKQSYGTKKPTFKPKQLDRKPRGQFSKKPVSA